MGVHTRRAPRRQIPGDRRHGSQRDRRPGKRQRIRLRHSEQQRFRKTRQPERQGHSGRHTAADQHRGLAQHQPRDLPPMIWPLSSWCPSLSAANS